MGDPMNKQPFQVNISRILNLPEGLIKGELEGLYGSSVLQDMREIINLYDMYEKGVQFPLNTSLDFTPADLRFKTASSLLNKVARFLFSKSPDFYIDAELGNDKVSRTKTKENLSVYQKLVDTVLEKNNFKSALLKAAKDCFIGKRVALMYNINEEGIQISFLPSLEFVYDVDPNDANKLTKIVAFYGLNDAKSKTEQRLYKKKYWMENGSCWYSEEIYDGRGQLVETIQAATQTLFPYIPAWVIINDGLTGDMIGVSEMEDQSNYERWYSRLSSGDIDAERAGMNSIKYTIDASPESTKGLSMAPGAFWDLNSDQNQAQDKTAQVGSLETPMSYSPALATTLDRIRNMAYEQGSVPNVSPEALKGVVSSGKTLRAIYWDLIVRCDEKMHAWRPALQFLVKCIIDGVKLYPEFGQVYLDEALPELEYTVRVENQYPLPEDEQEEKAIDLSEVGSQVMSRKSYMKKWRNLDDDEADEELRQIALERELLEDSFANPAEENSEESKSDKDEEEEE